MPVVVQKLRTNIHARGVYAGCRGFSLLELAIVLAIIGLVFSGLMFSLRAQLRMRAVNSTQHYLEQAGDALIAWAVSRPEASRLPCPDTHNRGESDPPIPDPKDPSRQICPHQEGWLPWLTLGLEPADAWGRRVRYRVDKAFSTIDDRGADSWVGIETTRVASDKIRVCTDADCHSLLAKDVAAILVSHGANGFGARLAGTPGDETRMVAVPDNISADEWQNIKGRNAPLPGSGSPDTQDASGAGSTDFVQRPAAQGEHALTEFDDQVLWLSPARVIGRLVSAGRLP